MTRRRRLLRTVTAVLLFGCAKAETARQADTTLVAVPTPDAPPSTDSVATIAAFERRVAAIERDTARMDRTQTPLTLGAGTTGRLTAWRVGPVWRRLRVEAEGPGFRSLDNYWFSDGIFLGARLELVRPKRKPAVDVVWFRGPSLYRWTDADGRHLTPEARSTQFEVQMMRARLDSLLHLLDTARTPTR